MFIDRLVPKALRSLARDLDDLSPQPLPPKDLIARTRKVFG